MVNTERRIPVKKEFFLETQLTGRQAALFYLGQEGFLIKYQDSYYLIDPYLSDYVDRNCCTDTVKWVRRYAAPVKPEQLDFVDYVLCTHAHFDHADPYTLRSLAEHNEKVKFIVPEPIKNTIASYGIAPGRIIGACAGSELRLGRCTVLPVPAAHEELHTDESGNYMELGYKLSLGSITLFHAGDCCIYDGLAEQLKDVDLLMVPVNGRSYYKLRNDIIGNMDAEEALLLAAEVKPRLLIPMHFDLYDVNSINPAHFVDLLFRTSPRQAFHIFTPGERLIFG